MVDRARFPRRKVCGACLGPAALAWMESDGLGGLPGRLGAVPLDTMELRAGETRADVPLDGHRALSRARLDEAMAAAAIRAGVVFRDACPVRLEGRSPDGRTVLGTSGEPLSARLVIDAAGLSGTGWKPDAAGPGPPAPTVADDARIGLGATFDGGGEYPAGRLFMVVGDDGYVGLVRTEDGCVNVAGALAPEAVRRDGAAGAVARVLRRGGLAPPDGALRDPWRGTPSLTRTRRRLGGAGVLVIGDAAGYVEPFTGEGIGWAIGSAIAVRPFAERAVEGWHEDVARAWTRAWRRTVAPGQRTCRGLAAALRRGSLVRTAVSVLAHVPGLASPLVRATGRRRRGAPAMGGGR
jgi:2-polyprenyl-6-methoxyphenol hydroxylase-like FAD-dependent oxidoreductase